MKNFISMRKKLKKLCKKPLIKMVFVGLLTSLFVTVIIAILLWSFRGKIFNFIFDNYSPQKNQNIEEVLITPSDVEKIEEEELKKEIATIPLTEKEEESVVSSVRKAKPAVVSILLLKEVPKYTITYNKENAVDKNGDTIRGVYIQKPIYTENGVEDKQVGSGSGFLISSNGLIVTNNHVVAKTDVKYKVLLNDGMEYKAEVLAKDSVLDVAIMKINASNLPYLTLADSDLLEVGQSVVAIGNALGEFKNTVSAGVISGLSRSITAGTSFGISEKLEKVIQTDTAINVGNSGGPLLNLKGEVVGINVAIVEDSSNIGFSIPINSVKDVINQVTKTGKIIRPYVGIRYIAITQKIKSAFNLNVDYGILIQKGKTPADVAVMSGSPAEKAGIVDGDIILEVNGQKITADTDFSTLVRGKKVGEILMLKVSSEGKERFISLILEQAPDSW